MRASFRVILDYLKGAQKARAQLEEIASQAATLARAQPEEIARHLRRYAARNQSDFFIHKRLQEALDDDLDIFVKTDVLNAEQLLAEDAGHLPARALRVARVIRNVGRRINAFLGVLEDFQKRLWEKKKLVLSTRYVITLDRLATLAGREFVEANLAAILVNAAQIAEWRALGLGERATAEAVRRQDSGFLPLPIDTLHFDENFKWALLAAVTKDHALDESLDGVAIHSDNWQALNTMQEKYGERVQAVYADPPYNTDAGPISYKNGYRHSSWLALMEHRLTKSKKLLEEKGIFCITIDDSEFHRLRCLSEACLSDFDILGVAAIKNNPAGRTTTSGFSVCHEYAVFLGREGVSEVNRLEHSQSQKDRYKEQDEIGFFEWTNFRKHGGVNTYKATRPRQFYPIYIKGEKIRFPMMEWNEKQRKWDIQEAPSTDEEVIWPIDEKGKERIGPVNFPVMKY